MNYLLLISSVVILLFISCSMTKLKEGLPLDNLAKKFKAFNWDCIEVKAGHSFNSIIFIS